MKLMNIKVVIILFLQKNFLKINTFRA